MLSYLFRLELNWCKMSNFILHDGTRESNITENRSDTAVTRVTLCIKTALRQISCILKKNTAPRTEIRYERLRTRLVSKKGNGVRKRNIGQEMNHGRRLRGDE